MNWIRLFLIMMMISVTVTAQAAHPQSLLEIAFNQAWFKNSYGHQYLDSSYDSIEVERMFKLTHEAGSRELRLWFFESTQFSLKNNYVKNVLKTLKIARENQVRVYMTIFDAQAYQPEVMGQVNRIRFERLFTEAGSREFLKDVILPLLNEIQKEGLTEQISKIDIVNEGDVLIDRSAIKDGWGGLKRMLCQWKAAVSTIPQFSKTPVTVSLRLDPYASFPPDLFEDQGTMACADFYDFHSYHTAGIIEQCDRLSVYSKRHKKPLVLGEFGQGYDAPQFDDELQLKNLKAYAEHANACGFSQAFAWRLSDVRDGHNPDARFSFEAYGKLRPAYFFIRDFNQR